CKSRSPATSLRQPGAGPGVRLAPTEEIDQMLVGISGKKRAGKDTLAAGLVEDLGFTRIGLADPLREAALRLDPIMTTSYVFDPDRDGLGFARKVRLSQLVGGPGWGLGKEQPGGRRTLQGLGTDVVRALDPLAWVREAMRQARIVGGDVVIPDVRFRNEA